MNHQNFFSPIIKLNDQLTEIEKVSLANLISFPVDVDHDLYSEIFNPDENILTGIYTLPSSFIIGGFVVKIFHGYQFFYVKDIAINPKLKSFKYANEIIQFLGDYGLHVFGENFKGIYSIVLCDKNGRNLNEKNILKKKCFLSSGAITVRERARIKNNFMHFIYIPYNGGHESDEVKEIFLQITKN